MRSDSATKDGVERWWYEKYELIQIVLTDDYQAVYAIEGDAGDCTLEAFPIHAVALAEVCTIHMMCTPVGKAVVEREEEPYRTVVGLELDDGDFDIVNHADNFAGLLRKGGNVEDATGSLRHSYCQKIKETQARRAKEGD